MRLRTQVIAIMVGLSLLSCGQLLALDNRADEALSKGKKLYADGRYEEAMDRFIDVFVTGNPDQIAQANEYVNLIHFDRGGVVPPKQVPYDKELEDRQNVGVQGKNLFDKDSKKKDKGDTEVPLSSLKEVPVQEEKEVLTKPEVSKTEEVPSVQETVAAANEQEIKEQKESEEKEDAKIEEESKDTDKDADSKESTALVVNEEEKEPEQTEEIIEEDSFPKGSAKKVRALQKQTEEMKRIEMRDEILTRFKENKDIQVYFRSGHIDAIDITASALFKGAAINKKAHDALDDIYSLMILENAPAYFILPEGSYTDEVTLQGVRQAVTLNSYLINRGISPARMNLNMGLTTQEPPEKFSDLAGISIVFDYTGKARLKSKLQENNLPPVLSLAVYPFKEITPALGETFVIDFSVTEASAPVQKWTLQIVSHSTDGHYYVVKQLSGEEALIHQVFWNGRKQFFGQFLPVGKYTVVLKATDEEGRERILKRQLVLKEDPRKIENAFIKTEADVEKAELNNTAKQGNLDYTQKRLWTKPGKKLVSVVMPEDSSEDVLPATLNNGQEAQTDNIAEIPQEPEGYDSASYGATQNPYDVTANPYDDNSSGEENYSGNF